MKSVFKVFFLSFCLSIVASDEREERQFFPFREPDNERARPCTTPNGDPGLCQDVTNCPSLLLDLRTLVRSICFQSLFRPGTCCPVKKDSSSQSIRRSTTEQPDTTTAELSTTTTTTTSTTDSTTTSTTTATTTTTTTPSTTTERPDANRPFLENNLRPPPPLPVIPDLSPATNTIDNTPYIPSIDYPYECGEPKVTQARVVNGSESYSGQWPWMAALYLHGFIGSDFHCGGTVISKQYIVTAAHCTIDKRGQRFSPLQFSVRLGDQDISNKNSPADKFAKEYRVESITVHPEFENFNHQYFRNDIALMKLSKPIEFSPFILPVCLPSKALSRAHIDALSGQMSTVIGYGRISYSGPQSKRLLRAEMPIWWNKACDDAYFPPILDTNICAGYVEGGIDSCQGDSGGPLLLYRRSKWVLLGIVSFGQKCAEPGYPGVYTRIPKFVEWIENNAV